MSAPRSYTDTLRTIARIYDIGNQLLRPQTRREAVVEYGKRLWADLHIDALGWGLLLSSFALIGYVSWFVTR